MSRSSFRSVSPGASFFGRTAPAFAALLFSACAPSDTNVSRVYPDLTVTPTDVDFGGVAVLYASSAQLQLINSGLTSLEIKEIRVTSEQGDIFSVDVAAPLSLAKDEQATLTVGFHPETYQVYAGTLTLVSNDELNPEYVIPLVGEGIYAPTPDIDVSPGAHDFGDVAAGETAFATIDIANVGTASLTLGNLIQVGSSAFSMISSNPSGYAIPAGQSSTVVYAYSPTHASGDNATLTIPSDDPDEASVVVPLLGNGGGDFEYPVASIVCPPVIVPREIVYLDGSASTSASGGELDYAWSINEIPSGSSVDHLSDSNQPVANLTPDIAGNYEVQLVVTDTTGISSSPAICQMNAIPEEDFHVELSWNGSSADLDLHVMTSAGAFFQEPYDCNFCNQSPDWGVGLDLADDPSLDIDDQYGWGPENTNIDSPVDDTYHVLVHYFASNSDEEVEATVRIYSYGVLVAEVFQDMTYDYVWVAGYVNWPAGTFAVPDSSVTSYYDNLDYDAFGTPLDVDPADGFPDQGPRSCF